MFDVGWQELLVIGIVALIVVGPKELPSLLRTVGKYVGLVKRQASEFRAQFDEAMRESELAQLKKDVEKIKEDAVSTIRDVERSVDTEISSVKRELDETAHSVTGRHPDAHDANGVPFSDQEAAVTPQPPSSPGAGAAAIAAAAVAGPPPATPPAQPSPGKNDAKVDA
jgi:sec-independent protein translocase protein TatB